MLFDTNSTQDAEGKRPLCKYLAPISIAKRLNKKQVK